MSEIVQAQARDLPLSEELRAGARALLEQPGFRVIGSDDAGRLGRFLWEAADQALRLEASVRALSAEIADEAKLPPSTVIRIPHLGRVS